MKNIHWRGLHFIVFVALLLCANTVVAGKSFLWQATSKTATVYLLGSVHMGVPSMYPMPKAVQDAYRQSDKIVVEVNENAANPMEVQAKMQRLGMYPGAETIADHVDRATYNKLTALLQQNNLPPQMFIKMKPGLIAITLSVMQLQKLGYSPALGIDRHFIAKATTDNKPILELETVDQQLELLLNFSDDALLLKHTLSQADMMEEVTAAMIESWKKGDADKLQQLILEDPIQDNPEYRPLIRRLITDRNHSMTRKIKSYLGTKDTYLVIVGAGHLVGDEGIVSLLRKSGFDIEQL